jgi:hypothetical protein
MESSLTKLAPANFGPSVRVADCPVRPIETDRQGVIWAKTWIRRHNRREWSKRDCRGAFAGVRHALCWPRRQAVSAMAGYYVRKHSWAASWCQGVALLCLPYFGLAIVLHRFGYITSPQAYWLIAVGLGLIFLTLALGARAFMDHWHFGMSGGPATMRGVLLALLLLGPYVWFGYLSMRYPLLSDVSTNSDAPPAYVRAAELRRSLAWQGSNGFASYDPTYVQILAGAYPELASRSYPAGSERVLRAVLALIRDRSWKLVEVRGIEQGELPRFEGEDEEAGAEPQADDAKPADQGAKATAAAKAKAKPAKSTASNAGKKQTKAEETETVEEPSRDIFVEAVAASLVFGFQRDVVIAIVAETESTVVDMRASSRFGPHDFGSSARLIDAFLKDLDRSLFGSGGQG